MAGACRWADGRLEVNRPVGSVLPHIFTIPTPRTVTQNLMLQYIKQVYQLVAPPGTRAFPGAQVLAREDAQGQITLDYQGRQSVYTLDQQQTRQADIVPSKQIDTPVEAARPKPAGRRAPPAQPPTAGGGLSPRGHFYFGLTVDNRGLIAWAAGRTLSPHV